MSRKRGTLSETMLHISLIRRLLLLVGCLVATAPHAEELRVAVAANFKQTAEELCEAFFEGRDGRCLVTPGASGLLYGKVTQGAPYDVFLSADRERPERLEQEGLAVAGTRFTYAIGRLVLWRPGLAASTELRALLTDGRIRDLAIANPKTAPYGRAGLETLSALGIDAAAFRLVQADSAGKVVQFVASGAADAGFVSLAQVLQYEGASGRNLRDEYVHVDPALHRPIEQQAVLLAGAGEKHVAREFMAFLASARGRVIIESAGYLLPPG
jgi:molybdate transport system substrate-binding protein